MNTPNNAYLLERIKDINEDLKDDNKALDSARKELVDAQEWVKGRELEVRKTEIRLEGVQGEYIDKNINSLTQFFFLRYTGSKENFSKDFDMWLETQPFEALRTIVETPRRVNVRSLAPDGSVRRPIYDTMKGQDMDDFVRRGEEKRQFEAEEHGI